MLVKGATGGYLINVHRRDTEALLLAYIKPVANHMEIRWLFFQRPDETQNTLWIP